MLFAACKVSGSQKTEPVAEASPAPAEPPVELTVYSQVSGYQGEQTGWFAKIMLDKFNVVLRILPDSDEEGEQVALDYQNRYLDELFKMTRDYHSQVPWYFQDNEGGFIDFSYERERCPIDLHPRGVVMNGINTRIL